MQVNYDSQIEVAVYFDPDGADIQTILNESICLYIKSEVKKLCQK